jgi:hypothetical protein
VLLCPQTQFNYFFKVKRTIYWYVITRKNVSASCDSSDGTSPFGAPKGKSFKFAHHSFYEESKHFKNNINHLSTLIKNLFFLMLKEILNCI